MKMPSDVVLSTKTFIISHLAILFTALIYFGGLYYVLYQDRFQPQATSYIPVTREPVSLFLEISNPEDNVLVYEDNILISGKTGPNYPVIISGGEGDTGLQSGKDGQFSKVINLSLGANIVNITVFDPQGNSKSQTKSIYYSEEKL